MMKKSLIRKEGFLRSFGRTASRMSTADQQKLEADMAPFVLAASANVPEVFKKQKKLIVELGVGKGEQILKRAAAIPEDGFIACEVFKNGLRFLVRGVKDKGLTNLKIFPEDARDLVQNLPPASVDQLLVLYPDPWPKARHKRRRLVNAELLSAAECILKPEGELILVTDVVDYAMWMLHQLYDEGSFFPVATSPAEWATPPAWWVQTGYERKALKEGRCPFYLVCRRKAELPQQAHNKGETTEKI